MRRVVVAVVVVIVVVVAAAAVAAAWLEVEIVSARAIRQGRKGVWLLLLQLLHQVLIKNKLSYHSLSWMVSSESSIAVYRIL